MIDSFMTNVFIGLTCFTIGILVSDPSAFAINDAGDLGGLMAGFSTIIAVMIALDARNTWKKQIAHNARYQSLVDLKKAVIQWITIGRRSESTLYGTGSLMRVLSRSQEDESAYTACLTELKNYSKDFDEVSHKYKDSLQTAQIVAVPIERKAIENMDKGIASIKKGIHRELRIHKEKLSPSHFERIPKETFEQIADALETLLNTTIPK
jgi:hypothetical protein